MSPHHLMRSGDSDDPRSQRNGSETQNSQAPNTCQAVRNTAAWRFVGDHTDGVTPVPIPNTAVKPVGPMIVPLARKSVIAGILQPDALELPLQGVFSCAPPTLPSTDRGIFPPPALHRPDPENPGPRGRLCDLTVLRFRGQTVLRFYGFTVSRRCGSAILREDGFAVSRFRGQTVLRFHGDAV